MLPYAPGRFACPTLAAAEFEPLPRQICQFSCGAASALATKITLAEYPSDQVLIVNAFLVEEHSDNQRFLADCEKWFNHPIIRLRDEKYGASTDEVWKRKRFIKGPHGAPCSLELKRKLLATIRRPTDIDILGYTCEEEHRLHDLLEHFPDREGLVRCPLIQRGIDKEHCLSVMERVGIELPYMYKLGYDNNNCIGCPKGGQKYWQNIREDFPQRFVQIKTLQEDIGPGANFLAFRSGPRKGERMSLAELPPGRGDMKTEPSFSCGFFCEMVAEEVSD